jgi:hypothetical protein
MIFIKVSEFSFGTIHLTQNYSSMISNIMSLFKAIKNTRIAEIQSDTILENIGPYNDLHSMFCMLVVVASKL